MPTFQFSRHKDLITCLLFLNIEVAVNMLTLQHQQLIIRLCVCIYIYMCVCESFCPSVSEYVCGVCVHLFVCVCIDR